QYISSGGGCSNGEHPRRFEDRARDPRKIWKLSPMDLESHRRWYDYSRARDAMFAATDTPESPWHVVRADDKRRARLRCSTLAPARKGLSPASYIFHVSPIASSNCASIDRGL